MKTNYIRAFAIFASILMVSIVAIPMIAAEDEYETCLDATKICDETHAEIKELFTELDIAIANYNQASKDGLHTYEYAEEINTILKEFESYGAEIEELLLLDVVIPYENEKLCKEIIELIYELEETIVTYNEAAKQGDTETQAEYFKKIGEMMSELQALGMNIEITGNFVITKTILGIKITITTISALKFAASVGFAYYSPVSLINLLESQGGDICKCCERSIRLSGVGMSIFWSCLLAKFGVGWVASTIASQNWVFVAELAAIVGTKLGCTNSKCMLYQK